MPPLGASILPGEPDDETYARLLNGFLADTDLEEFWSETQDLWEETRRDCERILAQCKLSQFLNCLFGKTAPIVFVANPADPSSFCFGPSDGKNGYAIVGPPCIAKDASAEVKYSHLPDYVAHMAVHESAHTLWGSLRRSQGWIVDRLRPLAERMELKAWFPEMYPDWIIQLDELFIRADTTLFVGRLTSEEQELAKLRQDAERFGIAPVLDFYDALKEFMSLKEEDEGTTFKNFLPEFATRVLSAI